MNFLKWLLPVLVLILTIVAIATKNEPNPILFISEDRSQQSLIQIVKDHNIKFAHVKSIKYNRIKFVTSAAVFFYIKPNKIFFESKGLIRKEMTVASDDSIFWFWIRSFDPNSVYYCSTNLIDKTRVIPLLKPRFATGMLGIDEIKPSAYSFENGLLVVKSDSRNIYFDREKIIKQEYFDSLGLYVSIEILKFHKLEDLYLPKEVKIILHRDNQHLTITLEDPEINGEWQIDTEIPPNLKKVKLEDY